MDNPYDIIFNNAQIVLEQMFGIVRKQQKDMDRLNEQLVALACRLSDIEFDIKEREESGNDHD